MTECKHMQYGRVLSQVVADLASEREAYRLTGNQKMVEEIERSAALTKREMVENYQDHMDTCRRGTLQVLQECDTLWL